MYIIVIETENREEKMKIIGEVEEPERQADCVVVSVNRPIYATMEKDGWRIEEKPDCVMISRNRGRGSFMFTLTGCTFISALKLIGYVEDCLHKGITPFFETPEIEGAKFQRSFLPAMLHLYNATERYFQREAAK